ncbi:TolC family protein [candidate division KSB1 bacterium]
MHGKYSFIRIIFLILIFNLPLSSSAGAEKMVLTLNDAIRIALKESYTVKSFRQDVIQREGFYRSQKANFRPYANLNVQTPNFAERVQTVLQPSGLPIYESRGSMEYDISLDFNYKIPTDGTFTLRSSLNRIRNEIIFENNTEEDLKGWTNMRLSFTQPIFTDNTLKEDLKQAELNYQSSLKRFNRNERNIIYNVTTAFYNLYSASREVEIYKQRMDNSMEAYNLAKLKYDAGIIPEVEALQLEVKKAESEAEYINALNDLETEKDSFKQLIGLPIKNDIQVAADIEYKTFEINLEKAIEEGLKNRSEIVENQIDVELSKINVKETKRQREFRGNIYFYYDFTGVSTTDSRHLSDLFNSSFTDFQNRPPNRGVTLNFSYPILDWGRNSARVDAMVASLRENELDLENQIVTIKREIREVVRNVKESENRLRILKAGQEVAEKSYNISKERFDNGDITSQDLALDQSELTRSQLSYLSAFVAYQRNVADLKRKTMWDFERNESYLKDSYIN